MITIDRRRSLFLASGVLVAGIDRASAQASVKYTGRDISSALDLQQYAVTASSDTGFVDFVVKSVDVRRSAVSDAANSEVFVNATRAVSDLRSSIGFAAPGIPKAYFSEERVNAQIDVIMFVHSMGMPLVPEVQDILPIGIPVVEPVEQRNEDTDLSVILDIAFQTMGIFEGKQLVDEALKDPDILASLHAIIPALKSKDWQELLKLLERVFQVIIAHGLFKMYAKIAAKRIAFRLGLRCVPILGWVYVVAAFLVALKANYRRFSFA